MKPEMLTAVLVVSNPIRWESRIRLALKCILHMLESRVKVIVVECAYGHRPFELSEVPGIKFVGVRAETLAWTKENLANIALRHLDPEDNYIALIDADVEFRNPRWASETVHALQQYAVVQPWSDALDLGPNGTPMTIKGKQVQTSFGKVWHETGDISQWFKHGTNAYSYPHPGYAWAFRRDALNRMGGFIEVSGLGAGDHQMAMAFIGEIEKSIHGETGKIYQMCIRAWAERAYAVVKGSVSYVSGTLEHAWHGSKDKRKYVERWDTLIKHDFNPITDLRKNLHGVLELAGNKPAMSMDFDRYFRQRDEDANILMD